MKLEDFVSYDEILLRLCKARAKLARQRGKSHLNHLISSDVIITTIKKVIDIKTTM